MERVGNMINKYMCRNECPCNNFDIVRWEDVYVNPKELNFSSQDENMNKNISFYDNF